MLEMPLRSTFSILREASEVEGGGGVVEDLRVEAGVDEGSEEHVATDAGEAVEIGDAHGGYCFMGEWRA